MDAVILDKSDPALIYAFTPESQDKKGRFIVRIDIAAEGGVKLNAVRSGGLVEPNNLRDSTKHEIIIGKI